MSTVDYVSFHSTVDDQTIPVPEVVAKRSHMIMDMIQGCNLEGSTPEPITLDVNYSTATLKLACELAMLTDKTPVPEKKTVPPKDDVVDPALRAKVEAVFPAAKELLASYGYQPLAELMKAFSFLQDMECTHVVGKAIASLFEGKTTEELRDIIGVVNDFTPEEEEDIKKNCRIVNFEKKEEKSE